MPEAGPATGRRSGRGRSVLDPVDVKLGAKVRELRIGQGLSQAELATSAGVTFQQLQKYEHGANRIAVSTLIRICVGLEISPGDLVDEIAGLSADEAAPERSTLKAGRTSRAIATIRSDEVRQAMLSLAKTIVAVGL